jgi:hypothetical protein
MGITKFTLYLQLLLSFINCLARADFINILVVTAIIGSIFTSYASNPMKYLNNFKVLVLFTLLYDISWMIFFFPVYILVNFLDIL